MTASTDLRWAQPWHYDARDRVTRPELCPEFIPPPPIGWQELVDAKELISETADVDG